MENPLTDLQLLDFRAISREGPTCTLISLDTPYYTEERGKLWIIANRVEFRMRDRNPGEAHDRPCTLYVFYLLHWQILRTENPHVLEVVIDQC